MYNENGKCITTYKCNRHTIHTTCHTNRHTHTATHTDTHVCNIFDADDDDSYVIVNNEIPLRLFHRIQNVYSWGFTSERQKKLLCVAYLAFVRIYNIITHSSTDWFVWSDMFGYEMTLKTCFWVDDKTELGGWR